MAPKRSQFLETTSVTPSLLYCSLLSLLPLLASSQFHSSLLGPFFGSLLLVVLFLLPVVLLFSSSARSFLFIVVIFLPVIFFSSLLPSFLLQVTSFLLVVIVTAPVVLLGLSADLCFAGGNQLAEQQTVEPRVDECLCSDKKQKAQAEEQTVEPRADEYLCSDKKQKAENKVVNRPTTLLDLPWDMVQEEIYGTLDFHSRVNFRNAFYFPPFMCSSLNSTDLLSLNVIASNEPWHLLHRVGSMKTNQELIHEFYLLSENKSHILVERLLLSPKIQVSNWHASIQLNDNLPPTINLAAAPYIDEVQYQIVGSEWSQIVGSEWGEL